MQLEEQLSPVLSPAEREADSTFLDSGRQACSAPPAASDAQTPEGPLVIIQRAFLAAIVSGQRQAALNIVQEALRNSARHLHIYVDVITQALRSVGSLWEQNKISVAQEHTATAIAQYVIAMIYPQLVPTSPKRGSVVVTGVAGEQH